MDIIQGIPITSIVSDTNYYDGILIKVTTYENNNHEKVNNIQEQNRYKRDESTKVKPFFSHELGIYVVPAVASEVKKIIKENAENRKENNIPSSSSSSSSLSLSSKVSKVVEGAAIATAVIPVSTSINNAPTSIQHDTISKGKDSSSNVLNSSTKPTKKKKLFVPNLYG